MLVFSSAFQSDLYASECGENESAILAFVETFAKDKNPDMRLMLNPEVFFRLQPAIRQTLGDQIILCPKIPLKNGKPVLKQKMDFSDIWDAMEIAIAADDWETVNLIASSAVAKPLPAEALFSLIIFPTFDEKSMKRLAKTLGIPLENAQNSWRFFLLDVFYAFGGRTEKQEAVYWAENEKQLGKARSAADARKENIKFTLFSGMNAEQAQQSLLKCGVMTAPAFNYINNR